MRSTSVRTMPTDGSRRPRFALASRLSPTTVCSPVPRADHLVRNRRDPSVRVVDVLDRRFCLGEGVLAQLYRSTVVSGGVRRGDLIERGVYIGSPYFVFAVVDETVERRERVVEAQFSLGHVGTQPGGRSHPVDESPLKDCIVSCARGRARTSLGGRIPADWVGSGGVSGYELPLAGGVCREVCVRLADQRADTIVDRCC